MSGVPTFRTAARDFPEAVPAAGKTSGHAARPKADRPTDIQITEIVTVGEELHPSWVRATKILLMGLERLEAQERQAQGSGEEDVLNDVPAIGPEH